MSKRKGTETTVSKVESKRRRRSASVPLVIYDDDGVFSVPNEARALLSSLDEDVPLVVVGVAGVYRSGKSSLLRLLFPGTDFDCSPTVNACTRGVWMALAHESATLPSGESAQVLVLDTEGLGDRDGRHDAEIFALSLLLSSDFVYNSWHAIDDRRVDELATSLQVANVIADGFPLGLRFTWVLRDFSLKLEAPDGAPMTADEYAEMALSPTDDPAKREARRTIKSVFPVLQCAPLVRPCDKDADVASVTKLGASGLRKQFREQLGGLKASLLTGAPRKTVAGGQAVTPRQLGVLAASYVAAINEGKVPDAGTAWGRICEVENARRVREAVQKFDADCEAAGVNSQCELEARKQSALQRLANGALLGDNLRVHLDRGAAMLSEKVELWKERARRSLDQTASRLVKDVDIEACADLAEVQTALRMLNEEPDEGVRAVAVSLIMGPLISRLPVIGEIEARRAREDSLRAHSREMDSMRRSLSNANAAKEAAIERANVAERSLADAPDPRAASAAATEEAGREISELRSELCREKSRADGLVCEAEESRRKVRELSATVEELKRESELLLHSRDQHRADVTEANRLTDEAQRRCEQTVRSMSEEIERLVGSVKQASGELQATKKLTASLKADLHRERAIKREAERVLSLKDSEANALREEHCKTTEDHRLVCARLSERARKAEVRSEDLQSRLDDVERRLIRYNEDRLAAMRDERSRVAVETELAVVRNELQHATKQLTARSEKVRQLTAEVDRRNREIGGISARFKEERLKLMVSHQFELQKARTAVM